MAVFLEICRRAVLAGGTELTARFGRAIVREKATADLVTDADLASQEAIVAVLRDALPDHAIVGEEDAVDGTSRGSRADYCWVVDPLDGTTNYAHGVPHFSVSLALLHRGQTVVAGVFDPVRDELFLAARGQGATLNGRPLQTSGTTSPGRALAAVGFPPAVGKDSQDLDAFLRAVDCFQSMRRTGSAALNLAYVAMGRFDAAWSYSTRIWDMAAGVLLVSEAGGMVKSPQGGEIDPWSGQFLAAATDELAREVIRLLNAE